MYQSNEQESGPAVLSPVVITALVRIVDSVLLEASLPDGPTGQRTMQLTLSTFSPTSRMRGPADVDAFHTEFAQLDKWMAARSELVLSIPANHQGVILAGPEGEIVVFGSV